MTLQINILADKNKIILILNIKLFYNLSITTYTHMPDDLNSFGKEQIVINLENKKVFFENSFLLLPIFCNFNY